MTISAFVLPSADLVTVVEVGTEVLLLAQASGGKGIIDYLWDFGDGSTLPIGSLVPHTYENADVCTVSVCAADIFQGEITGTASDELILTVTALVPVEKVSIVLGEVHLEHLRQLHSL